MNLTEPQKLWLAALRSGEYKQGKVKLQFKNEFCCLGVACKLAKSHDITVFEMASNHEIVGYHLASQGKVWEWIGLEHPQGRFKAEDGKMEYLTDLNDRGWTFEQIADIIEANAERIFRKRSL